MSAALVLGGVDVNGPYLSTVAPHGSTDRLPFVTMGSGSLAAMSVFEAEYKDDLTVCCAMNTTLARITSTRGFLICLAPNFRFSLRVSECPVVMQEKEAIDLVHKAISRGIFEDLGSGSNVDIRVVRKDGTDYHRGYDKPNERAFRKPKPYVYPPGSVSMCDTREAVLPLVRGHVFGVFCSAGQCSPQMALDSGCTAGYHTHRPPSSPSPPPTQPCICLSVQFTWSSCSYTDLRSRNAFHTGATAGPAASGAEGAMRTGALAPGLGFAFRIEPLHLGPLLRMCDVCLGW